MMNESVASTNDKIPVVALDGQNTGKKTNGSEKDEEPDDEELRPSCCILEPERQAFWLSRRRGKSLCGGGFGIVLTKTWPPNHDEKSSNNGGDEEREEDQNNHNKTSPKASSSSPPPTTTTSTSQKNETTSEEYLRIEEVLFLFERGVLEALDENENKMEAHQLYALLNTFGIPLQVYLTYAHLRQQSFRVLRHSDERRSILRAMKNHQEKKKKEEESFEGERRKRQKEEVAPEIQEPVKSNDRGDDSNSDTNTNHGDEQCRRPRPPSGRGFLSPWETLKRELREASARAQPPTRKENAQLTAPPPLVWDVYPPDQTFSRTAPGLPLFSVLATSYSHGTVPFDRIVQCIQENDPVPIKIATVSDSGIVVLFGVTNEGVPPRRNKEPTN